MTNWRQVYLTYPCPTCGVKKGYPCLTTGGRRRYECHAARAENADRCPECATRLPADAEPGDLCERCRLVRALEVERSTVYRRRT
jgi:hypothetical protein